VLCTRVCFTSIFELLLWNRYGTVDACEMIALRPEVVWGREGNEIRASCVDIGFGWDYA